MMVTRTQIVTEARSWLGTPYQHQARKKGVGTDCAGLILGVAKGLQLADTSAYDRLFYGRYPSGDLLRTLLTQHAGTVAAHRPFMAGQIALMRFDAEPQHLGILSNWMDDRVGDTADQIGLIHAYSNAQCVTEHRLADVWRARIVQRFEFPQLIETRTEETTQWP